MAHEFAGAYDAAVLDANSQLLKLVSFELVTEPGGVLATLYTDRLRTLPVVQPFLSDAEGNVHLFTDPGRYRLRQVGVPPGEQLTVQPDPEETEDELEAHVIAADPHPVYLTQAEGIAAFAPVSEPDSASHVADPTDAHDASAVSFVPTGTIAATDVQAAIVEVAAEAGGGEFFNVKRDFGAVGDGVTDDTVAIQAAIDAAAGVGPTNKGTVWLPIGSYKVMSLDWKNRVNIQMPGIDSATLLGTPGFDILVLPTGLTSYQTLRGGTLSGGRRGIAFFGGLTSIASTHVRLEDVLIAGPSDECIYTEGQIEEWNLDHVVLAGGVDGFRHANVGGSIGQSLVDKCTFKDVQTAGQARNGWRIEALLAGTNTWINPIIGTAGEHGFYGDGGFDSAVFINPNTEGNGQSGKSNYTTGSIVLGTAALTVANPAGFAPGDPIVVKGAGFQGRDLFANAVTVVGTLITLDTNASTTVVGQEVTNASFDDFFFDNTVANPGSVIWWGGPIGVVNAGGANLRYSINADVVGSTSVVDIAMSRPAYVPAGAVSALGSLTNIRQADNYLEDLLRYTKFPPAVFDLEFVRTLIASPPGRALVLGLRSATDNGLAPFGRIEIRRADGSRSLLARMDAENDTYGNFQLIGGASTGSRMEAPGGVVTGVKAGPPVDADWPLTNPPPNGTMFVDSTGGLPRLYVRVGGVWRFATLT